MSFKSTAQELIVLDPEMLGSQDGSMELVPLEVHDEAPHQHDEGGEHGHDHGYGEPIEVSDDVMTSPSDGEVVIEVGGLPGAPEGTVDPEPVMEVHEDKSDKKESDENEAASKKPEKWDWSSKGSHGFVAWIKERIDDVPKHSGYDSAGLERAVSYLEKLDAEISKAMRMDLDGELDANKIEKVRAEIDDGINRLHDRLDKVKKTKKRKKKSDLEEYKMVKEAQKITGVQGVYVTVDLLTSGIARVCINGMVSAGHDIEDLYARQVKKFNLNEREQAQVMWLLADMGYPLRRDRGFMPDEEVDTTSSDNMDWAANYKG
jgi:hypothetical protein